MRKFFGSALLIGLVLPVILVAGCSNNHRSALSIEGHYTQNNQSRLLKAQPPPFIAYSLERQNLIERYKTLSDRNKTGYVYLIDHGLIVTHYVIRGKLSSVSSELTAQQQIGCKYNDSGECGTVDQAEPDGSYGTNGEGIFFFTVTGAYVEWRGDYLYSDQPLTLNQPTVLSVQAQVKP